MIGSVAWVVLAVSLTLLQAGCGQATPAPAAKPAGQAPGMAVAAPTAVQVAAVQRGTLSNTPSYSGNVQARQQVSLVPKVTGRLTKLAVDVGSVVKAGDALLELERDTLAAQVAQAEAGLAAAQAKLNGLEAGPRSEQVGQAEANLKAAQARLDQLKAGPTADQRRVADINVEAAKARLNGANVQKDGDCNKMKPEYLCQSSQANAFAAANAVDAAQAQYDALVAPPTAEQLAQAQAAVDAAREQLALAKRPVTQYDLQAARAAVAQAKATGDIAKLQLGEATVRAPFSGVISQRLVSEGAMVGPSSPLLVLISTDAEVVVNVDERALATLKAGQPATVTASAYPGDEFPATVASVAPAVDARSRTVQVRLSPQNSEGKLRDGMFAQVRLLASAVRGDALLVPKSAVVQEQRDTVVYSVDGGRVKRQVVTTGTTDGERIEIVEGLVDGQKVAVSGLSALRDGAEVTVQ